jgi:glycosyltransferase involved in cell wall biosynthesis
VVGILASLTPPKDHATFLRAAAKVARARPAARFAIIGDGPLRADLEALAADLGIAERVVFFGYQRRVADFLAACDLLVSSSQDNEGCSNSVLEAMAVGVPVIATDVGGSCELVDQGVTGFLVPVGDSDTLAAAVADALTDLPRTRAMAERARQVIDSRFGLRRMVAEYEALYTTLLHRERPAAASVPVTAR